MNSQIVEMIKNARNERGKTQQDLADALNKTRAAISDMERGKVQVSAEELYIIAKLLNKPIEYFYGEDFSGKEVQDIIAATRMQTPEAKSSTIETLMLMMRFQSIGKRIEKYKGKEIPKNIKQEFYDTIIPLSKIVNELADTINGIIDELKIKEVKTPKK